MTLACQSKRAQQYANPVALCVTGKHPYKANGAARLEDTRPRGRRWGSQLRD